MGVIKRITVTWLVHEDELDIVQDELWDLFRDSDATLYQPVDALTVADAELTEDAKEFFDNAYAWEKGDI